MTTTRMDIPSVVIPGRDVRMPTRAREAISHHHAVHVQSHDRAAFVVLHPDDFAFVEPLLARRRQGLPVPVEDLLTDDDFEVLAEERLVSSGIVGQAVLSSWAAE